MIKPGTMIGVLNDFDLASVMQRGATSPPKIGYRGIGTPLFMAVNLLSKKALRSEVPRLYRHDLESFAWVLLYGSLCVKDGKENLDVEPFRDWVSIDSSQLYNAKTTLVQKFMEIPEWLIPTFRVWFEVAYKSNLGNVLGPEHDPIILGSVLRAWGIDKEDWEDFI